MSRCPRRWCRSSRGNEDTARYAYLLVVHHGKRKTPLALRSPLLDPEHTIYLSTASVWEVVVKHQLGKIELPSPPARYLPLQREAHGIVSLPIDEGAMDCLANLPQLHRDPFDRVLIAQALQHDLRLATVDKAILAYDVPTLPV